MTLRAATGAVEVRLASLRVAGVRDVIDMNRVVVIRRGDDSGMKIGGDIKDGGLGEVEFGRLLVKIGFVSLKEGSDRISDFKNYH